MRLLAAVALLAFAFPAVPASPPAWSDEQRVGLLSACLAVNDGAVGAELYCKCLNEEAEKRIPGDKLDEWVHSGGEAHNDFITRQGNAAAKVCRDRVLGQLQSI